MIRKIRASLSEKKGFTLVELVVVLVILAILAALLMPSLTGYIDKAKEKRVVAEVHQVVTAAQSLADEAYALETDDLTGATYTDTIFFDAISALAESEGELKEVVVDIDTGKIVYVKMDLSGITGYYTPDEGIVADLADGFEAPKAPDGLAYAKLAEEPSDG